MEIIIADKPTLDQVKITTSKIRDSLSVGKPPLYGVRINKLEPNPENRVEYIHDAIGMTPSGMNYNSGVFNYGSWDNIWFIKKLKPCVLDASGNVVHYLNPKDYTKQVNGTASAIGNDPANNYNVMVEIPLVWLYQYESGNYEYILVCETQYDERFKAYAHTRSDGSIADKRYLACYKSVVAGGNVNRSISGKSITSSQTFLNASNYSSANGTGWGMRTWWDRNLINSLLILMGKSDDSQTVFGNGNRATSRTTGELNSMGLFHGYGGSNWTNQVKVFGIEGWWGDKQEFLHGLVVSNGVIKYKYNSPYTSDGADYSDTGIRITKSYTNFGKSSICGEFGRFPIDIGGSSSTYLCDTVGMHPVGGHNIAVGGNIESQGLGLGMNNLHWDIPFNSSGTQWASALAYETPSS